ncbi:HIT family protein [bacterium]|nr:HIT family protein [bacterium]
MTSCIFCKIYKAKEGVIYENKFFYAQFDAFPVSPGHAEVIPIRHVTSFLELTEKEWMSLKSTISKVIEIIEKTNLKELYEKFLQDPLNEKSEQFCKKMLTHIGIEKKPDGYNIGVNEGEAAGRTIDHLHIHIIPRYSGDVKDYVGGIRHVIPGMGNYRK